MVASQSVPMYTELVILSVWLASAAIVLFEAMVRCSVKKEKKVDYQTVSLESDNQVELKELEHFLDWRLLSANPRAVPFLEKNLDKVNWNWLSLNPNAIHLLEAHPDKINWMYVSANPNAISLLEANLDKIHWSFILQNYNAIHLIQQYKEKINWDEVSYLISAFDVPLQSHSPSELPRETTS